MTAYEPPTAADVEQAYRDAHRAMERILPPDFFVPERDLDIPTVITQLWPMIDRAESVAAGQFGVRVSWEASYHDGKLGLMVGAADLDAGTRDLDGVELHANVVEVRERDWLGSALDLAGKAYKRACGWDFAPGQAGIWLVALIPDSATGADGASWTYGGNIVGFVVVYDRDEDGEYEAIGHMWTAATWRRKGIARRLLAEARSRFPISVIEEPYTDDGSAFVEAVSGPRGANPGGTL